MFLFLFFSLDVRNENRYRLHVVTRTQEKSAGEPVPPEPRRVSSEALLGPKKELRIAHSGREYRLRLTRNGKLILTA